MECPDILSPLGNKFRSVLVCQFDIETAVLLRGLSHDHVPHWVRIGAPTTFSPISGWSTGPMH